MRFEGVEKQHALHILHHQNLSFVDHRKPLVRQITWLVDRVFLSTWQEISTLKWSAIVRIVNEKFYTSKAGGTGRVITRPEMGSNGTGRVITRPDMGSNGPGRVYTFPG